MAPRLPCIEASELGDIGWGLERCAFSRLLERLLEVTGAARLNLLPPFTRRCRLGFGLLRSVCVYYCSTNYKAVRGEGTSLPITH